MIRVNPDEDETLIGKPFLRDRLVVVASPDFARPAEDKPVAGVVRGSGVSQTWDMMTPKGLMSIEIEPVLALSSLIMAVSYTHLTLPTIYSV